MFSLFPENVSLEEKAKIRDRVLAAPRNREEAFSSVAMVLDETTVLTDLIGEASWFLFELTVISHTCLASSPEL